MEKTEPNQTIISLINNMQRHAGKLTAIKPACKLLKLLLKEDIFSPFIEDAVGKEEGYFSDSYTNLIHLDVVTSIAIKAVGALNPFSIELPLRSRIYELLQKMDLNSGDEPSLGGWGLLLDEDSHLTLEGTSTDEWPLFEEEEDLVNVELGNYGKCPTYQGYWFY